MVSRFLVEMEGLKLVKLKLKQGELPDPFAERLANKRATVETERLAREIDQAGPEHAREYAIRQVWKQDVEIGTVRASLLVETGWATEWATYNWANLPTKLRADLTSLSLARVDVLLDECTTAEKERLRSLFNTPRG